MQTRKRSKGAESRGRLLAAAVQEFAERGYHSAKISEIVKRAGVTQPTFYDYFQSKEEVFEQLVKDFRGKIWKIFTHPGFEHGLDRVTLKELLYGYLMQIIDLVSTEPQMAQVAMEHAADAEEFKQELRGLLVEQIRRNQEAGYFQKNISVEIAADCAIGAGERLILRYALNRRMVAEELAKQYMEFVLNGLLVEQTC